MNLFLLTLAGTFLANMGSGYIFYKLAAKAEKKKQEAEIPKNTGIIGKDNVIKQKTDYQYFKDFIGKGPSTAYWETSMLSPELKKAMGQFDEVAKGYVAEIRKEMETKKKKDEEQ